MNPQTFPDPARQSAVLQRFEHELTTLERVAESALARGLFPAVGVVGLAATILLRAAMDWHPRCGLSWPTYAAITLRSELLGLRPGALPAVPFPAELDALHAPLDEMVTRLTAREEVRPPVVTVPLRERRARLPVVLTPTPMVSPTRRDDRDAPAFDWPRWWAESRRRLPWVIGLVLATELGILAHTWQAPPSWVAAATLDTGIGSKHPFGGGNDWFTQGTMVANISELLKSRSVLEQVAKTLQLSDPPEELARRLTVSRLGQAGLLRVEGQASEAQAAAELVNTLIREFLAFYAGNQSHQARSDRAFIEHETSAARQRLRAAEEALKRFRHDHLPELQANLPTRTGDLLAQRDEAQRNLLAAEAALRVVQQEQARLRRDPGVREQVQLSLSVRSAREQLTALQAKLSDARQAYPGDSSAVRGLEKQVQNLKQGLQASLREAVTEHPALAEASTRIVTLRAEVAMQQARLRSLNRSLGTLQPQARNASRDQVTFEQLQREVRVTETQYLDLQTKLGQSELAAVGADHLPLSVVDPAQPPAEPESNRLVIKLLLGLLLSGGLGLFGLHLAHLRGRRRTPAWATPAAAPGRTREAA